MRAFEKEVIKQVNGGQIVHYNVEPVYADDKKVVPVAYVMMAFGTDAAGVPGFRKAEVVPNSLYGRKTGTWYNLGLR